MKCHILLFLAVTFLEVRNGRSFYSDDSNEFLEVLDYSGNGVHECPGDTRHQLRIKHDICKLPADKGPCKAHFPRFFYNSTSMVCEPFIYGGCGDNKNNFLTVKECTDACQTQDVCKLPPKPGPCLAYMSRYFYNATSKTCQHFIFGGCQENGNNFLDEDECFKRCHTKDVCKLNYKTGPCRAFISRYFFNPTSLACEPFTYGGCESNGNNFETEKECLLTCRAKDACKLHPETGPCNAAFQRYFYNTTSMMCESFIYGGCKGNGNNFISELGCIHTCQTKEVCKLHYDAGPCLGFFPRYFYNSTCMKCEPFTYGGCHGNGNNFRHEKECLHACQSEDVCKLHPETGFCKAHIPRYFYNYTSMTCQHFIYGGCGGNGNNFHSEKDCFDTCRHEDVCKLKPEVGPCEAIIHRYFYNSTTMTCDQFNYGGCSGNGNNFHTKKECLQECQNEDVCKLNSDPGRCYGFFPRYFYNSTSQTCEKFIYGGCGGNGNNFDNEEECLQTC
ncbi:papilin-like [Protopterus annectens]|uniref:papilin-like n=1 Tax=Protopterus annectens TaxID=7888 RepID=UPI001CFA4592|nr:papilin-like [Protopterus annectens]